MIIKGKKVDALEYLSENYIEPLKGFKKNDEEKKALQYIEELCDELKNQDYESASNKCEWALKYLLFGKEIDTLFSFDQEIRSLNSFSKKETANNQYSAITETLFNWVEENFAIKILREEDIKRALFEPPKNSRAFLRKEIINRFGDRIDGLGWNYVVIDNRTHYFNELKDYNKEEIDLILEAWKNVKS